MIGSQIFPSKNNSSITEALQAWEMEYVKPYSSIDHTSKLLAPSTLKLLCVEHYENKT